MNTKIATTKDLRFFLLEQMEGVANGKVNSEKAKSICNLSQQIYNTINMEVKMAVAKSKMGEGRDVQPVDFTS